MVKNWGKMIDKLPKILGIVFVCFLMSFSLDVFESGKSFWQILIGLFMHNIPAFVLLFFLFFSKRHELIASFAFIFAGFIYIWLLFNSADFEWYMITWSLLIAGPAFLIGILFAFGWYQKRHGSLNQSASKN